MRLLPVLAMLAACASAPPVRPAPAAASRAAAVVAPADANRAVQLRAELQDVLAAQGDVLWKAWTQGGDAQLASTWSGHKALLDPQSVAAVRRAAAKATGGPARDLERLAAFLAAEQITAGTVDLAARAAEERADATFTFEDREHPLPELERMLAAEPDRERRRAMAASAVAAQARAHAALEQLRSREVEIAIALGYGSTGELALALRGGTAAGLRALASAVLDATAASFQEALDGATREALELPLADLDRSDVPRLFAAPILRPRFPRGGALPALEQTLADLHLPLRGTAGLTLLDGPSPQKDPRAACFPVRVPGDVRLSLLPQTTDWPALLRESATAVRLLLARGEVLGPGGGVTGEAFAVLFERLAADEAWLRRSTALTDPEVVAVRRAAQVRRLWSVRKAAARVIAELDRSPPDTGPMVLEPDPFLAAADQMRGAVLGAMIERRLRADHGAAWWSKPEAGAELAAWLVDPATGQDLDPSAL